MLNNLLKFYWQVTSKNKEETSEYEDTDGNYYDHFLCFCYLPIEWGDCIVPQSLLI